MHALTRRPVWERPSVWSYGEVKWDRDARGGGDTVPPLPGFRPPPGNRVLVLPEGSHLVEVRPRGVPHLVELSREVPCVIGGDPATATQAWGTATDPFDARRPCPVVTVPARAVTRRLRTIPRLLQDARGRNPAFCQACGTFPTSQDIDACPPPAYGTLCARMVDALSLGPRRDA